MVKYALILKFSIVPLVYHVHTGFYTNLRLEMLLWTWLLFLLCHPKAKFVFTYSLQPAASPNLIFSFSLLVLVLKALWRLLYCHIKSSFGEIISWSVTAAAVSICVSLERLRGIHTNAVRRVWKTAITLQWFHSLCSGPVSSDSEFLPWMQSSRSLNAMQRFARLLRFDEQSRHWLMLDRAHDLTTF